MLKENEITGQNTRYESNYIKFKNLLNQTILLWDTVRSQNKYRHEKCGIEKAGGAMESKIHRRETSAVSLSCLSC